MSLVTVRFRWDKPHGIEVVPHCCTDVFRHWASESINVDEAYALDRA
jgi:hypothetical protein